MHFTLSTLIQNILSYFNPLLNNFIMGDIVVKPCLASVFSFMLLGISFWVSIQKQIFNQIAQYSLHLVTLISFLAILGMSDNIPSLDQIDF
jgi:hypothetical protein